MSRELAAESVAGERARRGEQVHRPREDETAIGAAAERRRGRAEMQTTWWGRASGSESVCQRRACKGREPQRQRGGEARSGEGEGERRVYAAHAHVGALAGRQRLSKLFARLLDLSLGYIGARNSSPAAAGPMWPLRAERATRAASVAPLCARVHKASWHADRAGALCLLRRLVVPIFGCLAASRAGKGALWRPALPVWDAQRRINTS